MNLTEAQIQRYSRHILLPEVGGAGQKRLLESSSLIVFTREGEGAAAVAAAYLVAGGLGKIGWCRASSDESLPGEGGSFAGLAGLYDPAGTVASAAALNSDVCFEVIPRLEIEADTGAIQARYDLLILSGRSDVLDMAASRFEESGKPVLRGVRAGWAGSVLLGSKGLKSEILNSDDFSPEETDEPLPAAPSEGVLGAMLASSALRALLKGEELVGSTALARFDLSRGKMKMVSR